MDDGCPLSAVKNPAKLAGFLFGCWQVSRCQRIDDDEDITCVVGVIVYEITGVGGKRNQATAGRESHLETKVIALYAVCANNLLVF
jgi:hypothetical protein